MKYVLPFVLLFMIFISCTKERGVTGPAGPQGPAGAAGTVAGNDTGTISGRLGLYDEFSNNTGTGAGVIVTLTSGSLKLADTTDVMGVYQFSGIKTGTYDLTYLKPGFGTMKVLSLSHFAGGVLPTHVNDVILVQIPIKTAPANLYRINTPYNYFSVNLDTSSLSYAENIQNIGVFVSKDKNVSSLNYQYKMPIAGPDGTGGYLCILSGDVNNPLPFRNGDTLYAVAYTYNSYVNLNSGVNSIVKYITDGGTYIDPQTGITIYPNLSKPSNILKFAL